MNKNGREHSRTPRTWTLLLIAIFKLFRGLLLTLTGIGLLSLLHKDVAAIVLQLATALNVDPDNRVIQGILVKLWGLNDRKLEAVSAGTFFYAALLTTEGVGLLMRQRWAEYFTIITTAALVPLEVYELIQHFTMIRVLILVANLLIVAYLVARRIAGHRRAVARAAIEAP
jgi:uncharacterized membrane protein (DUF2068 family)